MGGSQAARLTRILLGGLQVATRRIRDGMTARSKLRGQKKEAASSFCPFAPVESFLVAKVGIGERRCCGDVDRVVT